MYNLSVLLLVTAKLFVIFGQELSEKDYEIIKISINDSELPRNVSEDAYKAILRYGFQRPDACKQFDRAYLCIKKCLHAGYEIGESDKKCQCRCYKNRVLAAHKSSTQAKMMGSSKFTAPTTWRPSWAIVPLSEVELTPKSDKELFADLLPENDDASGSGSGSGSGNGIGDSDSGGHDGRDHAPGEAGGKDTNVTEGGESRNVTEAGGKDTNVTEAGEKDTNVSESGTEAESESDKAQKDAGGKGATGTVAGSGTDKAQTEGGPKEDSPEK